MLRSGKSRNERIKAPTHQSNYYSNIRTVNKIPKVSKIEMKITNQAHSSAPVQLINNSHDEGTHRSPMIKDIPFYLDATYRLPCKPVRTPMPGGSQSSKSTNIDPETNIDFGENSPFQEGIILEMYQRAGKAFFQEPKELAGLINTGNLVQTFLPKQIGISKIFKIIQRKVIKGTHLPCHNKGNTTGRLLNQPIL